MSRRNIQLRKAVKSDLEGIVDVELERYEALHEELGNSRKEVKKRFSDRLRNIGDWYFVAIDDGTVVGSISALPTNSTPDEFESWEASTDNGTCSSYDEGSSHKNLYVINLDVSYSHTKYDVQSMLMSVVAAKAIHDGYNLLYFESRMPQLREWIEKQGMLEKWSTMTSKKKMKFVVEYSQMKNTNGKPHDRLLRFYAANGFTIYRIVSDAFEDPESLNYGAVFSVKNPAHFNNRYLRAVAARIFLSVSRHPKLLSRIL